MHLDGVQGRSVGALRPRLIDLHNYVMQRLVTIESWPHGEAAMVKGARVVPGHWHVVLRSGTLLRNPSGHPWRGVNVLEGDSAPTRATMELPSAEVKVEGRSILVGGYNNFYHSLVDYFVNWYYVHHLAARGDTLLVTHHMHDYNEQIMEFLGLSVHQVLRELPTVTLLCEDLIVPPRCVHGVGSLVDSAPMRWMRQRALNLSTRPYGSRLYVSRSRAATRRVSNEDHLLGALIPLGFEAVELSDLSFAEQAARFAHADIVVSAHGAGLANILFMRQGAHVVELIPPVRRTPEHYSGLAAGLGIGFSRSFGTRDHAHRNHEGGGWRTTTALGDPTFRADVPDVLKLMSAALGRSL